MIKLEHTEVVGWEHAIRGMRNPMNSWNKSDTVYIPSRFLYEKEDYELARKCHDIAPIIKANDLDLMQRLREAGTDHRKFMRMITVYVDITAPFYWWKEFDTYKVGTVANSCSTMHKIHVKEFTLDDFSHEHLKPKSIDTLEHIIDELNTWRIIYLEGYPAESGCSEILAKDKDIWWQMIQLLPTSYNQKRTIMFNYEVLANIYKSRKNHKLDEWHDLCDWIKTLPYSELITKGE